MKIFFLSTLCLFNSLMGVSVVIIGGGPAGLATAIEAHAAGADVTLVEKRDQYTRERFIFLLVPALELLEQWGVSVPGLLKNEFEGDRFGLTNIRNLEEALSQRVNELGIPKIVAEFKEIGEGHVLLDKNLELPFDILVGADGLHSSVREHLNIQTNLFGHAFASIAIFPRANLTMDFIFPFRSNTLFLNKIAIPPATVIFAQGDDVSKEMMALEARQLGWLEEARLIESNEMKFVDKFEIVLQQAATFSDYKKSAILLGDSAACASFLQGKGANFAFEAAKIAGLLFRSELKEVDYADFNSAMKELTDELIEDSAFLFQ